MIGGETFVTTYIDNLRLKFHTDSTKTNCKVIEWEIIDSDTSENPVSTILVDAAKYKLQDTKKKFAVNTWIEGYRKVIYMRNKNRNPTGVCNWQCYIDRHSDLNGMTWE